MLLLTLILGITGFGGSSSEKDGSVTTDLIVTHKSEVDLPEKVKKKVDELKHAKNGGQATVIQENRVYLIVALGQRNTGGYSVKITRAELVNDTTLHIYAQEEEPPKNAFTTQVISYPVGIGYVDIDTPDRIKEFTFHLQKSSETTVNDR